MHPTRTRRSAFRLAFALLWALGACSADVDIETDLQCTNDPCSVPGDTLCDGTQIVECVESDPACGLEWTAVLDCADADQTCSVADDEAACATRLDCPDTPCVAVGAQCDGNAVRTCETDADGCLVVASTEDCAGLGQVCAEGPPAACETLGDAIIVGDYVYEVVVDLDSTNPGAFGPFQYLEQNPTLDPVTDEPTVYFRATSSPPITPPQASPARALYSWTPSQGIALIAEATNPIPRGFGGFTSFGQLANNPPIGYDGAVTFVGDGMDLQRGVYRHANGTTDLIADKGFAVPGGTGTFTGLGEPHIIGNEVVFLGTAPGGGGFYRWNAGEPVVFVDLNTPNPVADGDYTGLGLTDFNGTDGIFLGYGAPLPGASYTGNQTSLFIASTSGGAHDVIATKETAMPDVDDQFTILTGGLFDGDGVFFHGRGSVGPIGPFGSIVHKGLYRWEDGTIETIVNTQDVMPGSSVTFSEDFANGITSQYMATHGGDLLYRGVGTVEDERVLYGIYRYRGDTGVSEKVIDTSDRFDGKVMTDILMSRKSFLGDHFVVWIRFDDDSQGIYLGQPLD